MKTTKRVLICMAILMGVFIVAALTASCIVETLNDAKYAPGDKDRKYESIGDAVTVIVTGFASMLTIGAGIVIWKVRKWRRQDKTINF